MYFELFYKLVVLQTAKEDQKCHTVYFIDTRSPQLASKSNILIFNQFISWTLIC